MGLVHFCIAKGHILYKCYLFQVEAKFKKQTNIDINASKLGGYFINSVKGIKTLFGRF